LSQGNIFLYLIFIGANTLTVNFMSQKKRDFYFFLIFFLRRLAW